MLCQTLQSSPNEAFALEGHENEPEGSAPEQRSMTQEQRLAWLVSLRAELAHLIAQRRQ